MMKIKNVAPQATKAVTTKKLFSRETTVSIDIFSDPVTLWNLLINTSDMPRWNSTIISIEGEIKMGGKIRLRSTLDPKRVFTLYVKELVAVKRLVLGDATGRRVYTLKANESGSINFTMTEKIGGPFFPLFARLIPPFDLMFENYARDLKSEAEAISHLYN